jgi:putative transport protein
MLPDARMVLAHDDALLLVGEAEALDRATAMAGHADPRRIASDRRDLDVVRVHVSKPHLLGCRIADLPMPDFPLRISKVRRGDVEMLATPDLVVESGDRLAIIAPRDTIADVRAYFGDSIRAVAEFSYVSVGFGMVLGLALGAIPIPVPGAGTFRLGVAGGPLLMALLLGWRGRTGHISWTIPPPANLALRNFGLTIFLAAVAIGAGKPFVETLAQSGMPMLLAGAAVVLTNVLIVMLGGLYVFRMPYDSMIGVVCGATGQPAIPVYAARLLQSDRVDTAYAMIFPTMAITKVIVAQIIVGVFRGGS